jgi:hypothetical protein
MRLAAIAQVERALDAQSIAGQALLLSSAIPDSAK